MSGNGVKFGAEHAGLRARALVFLGVGLGCVAAAPSAAARDLTHTVQVSLDGTLLSYESVSETPDAQPAPAFPFGGGFGDQQPSLTVTSSSFSLLGSGFGLGVGYAPSDHVLIGAQLQLSTGKTEASSSTQVSADFSTTSASILPRLEYVFGGSVARPYLAAVLGLRSTSSSPGDGSGSNSSTRYLYGGAFGVHAFLNDHCSFDPAVTLLGESGSDRFSALAAEAGNLGSADYSVGGALVLLSVSLSVWLGGIKPPPVSNDAEVVPPPDSTMAQANADSDSDTDAGADTARPIAPPLSAQVGLPGQRELDLQVARDPTLPSILVRIYEQQAETELLSCRDIRVQASPAPVELNVTSVGNQPLAAEARHFVVGVLPLRGLVALAQGDTKLLVCSNEWSLSDASRAEIQDFLSRRQSLIAESGAAPTPAPAAAPTPATPATPAPATPAPATPAPAPAPAPAPPGPKATPTPPPSATFPDTPPAQK